MLQNEIMCQKFVLTQNPLAEEEHNKLNLFFIQLLLITFYNLLPFELVCAQDRNILGEFQFSPYTLCKGKSVPRLFMPF